MSSLGSSFINKTNKKIAPKVPQRRRNAQPAQSVQPAASPSLTPRRSESQDLPPTPEQPAVNPSSSSKQSEPSAPQQPQVDSSAPPKRARDVEASNASDAPSTQPPNKRVRVEEPATHDATIVTQPASQPPPLSQPAGSSQARDQHAHGRSSDPAERPAHTTNLPQPAQASQPAQTTQAAPQNLRGQENEPPSSTATQNKEQSTAEPRRKRTRGDHGQSSTATAAHDDAAAEAPPKKQRKVRSDKGIKRAQRPKEPSSTSTNNPDAAQTGDGALPTPSATQSRSSAEQEGGDGNDANEAEVSGEAPARQQKRRGRRRRESTASGDEARATNTGSTTMFDLRKDKRTGPISHLEQAMRKIDWAQVKQQKFDRDVREMEEAEARIAAREAEQQSENDDLGINDEAGEEEAENEEEGGEQGQGGEDDIIEEDDHMPANSRSGASRNPRLRMVNGQIQFDNSSLQIDRHAEAEAAIQDYDDADVAMEESDLTNQTNTRSFLGENKRDPRDRFAVKHKGDPWNAEQTARFYDAIRMFGTDFMIVSKMFPGKTRAQIKAKYTREERTNGDLITAALIGETKPMDVGVFASAAGRDEASFKDPAELRAQLAREKEGQREALEKQARVKAEEQERKRDAARERQEAVQKQRDERRRRKDEKRAAQKLRARRGVNFVDHSTEEVLESVEGDPGPADD